MEYAHVRLTNEKIVRGFYIGATSDAVYLAPNHTCHVERRILALPQRRVKNVFVITSSEAWPNKAPEAAGKCESPR
jgi:hypothetical protein